eukprot:GHVN01024358.1.p2 GENE.GHVN01024358.1~~GHVN01024358.1.p2  ORF type:complete len:347 (-),score=31.98 GHVN01024358.1:1664-2704(-)
MSCVSEEVLAHLMKRMRERCETYSQLMLQLNDARFGIELSIEDVTLTSGASEALYIAITVVVHPQDEVLLFEPSYDSYQPVVELNGGSIRHVPMQFDGKVFRFDWQATRKAITPKTRAIIVNSPHNPTGRCFSEEDWDELEAIVVQNNIFIISDEVYEHISFIPHLSALMRPQLWGRSLVVSSLGKTFSVTGWDIGCVLAASNLTQEIRKMHQYITFSSFTPVQHAFADMLCRHQHQMGEWSSFFKKRRDFWEKTMSGSRFTLLRCEGAMFSLADYSRVDGRTPSGVKASDLNDADFCIWLLTTHKVAAIPISAFYRSNPGLQLIRFCFAKDEETLREAAAILKAL